MATKPKAQARFFDGMRVAREHLEHLQELALRAGEILRESLGSGIVHGLRVWPAGPNSVRIEPGLAFSPFGQALEIKAPVTLEIPTTGRSTVVLVHHLRGESPYKGSHTLIHDEIHIDLRQSSPPYVDGAIRIAEVESGDPEVRIRQNGEWFLAPPRHGHTGTFRMDEQMRWRYDGTPAPFPFPDYDSGPLEVEVGESKILNHGLSSREIKVVLETMDAQGGASSFGFGRDYWYEIPSEDSVVIRRAPTIGSSPLLLRTRIWACGSVAHGGTGLVRPPLADAGTGQSVNPAMPFTLNGERSRAFSGRKITKYIWTQLS